MNSRMLQMKLYVKLFDISMELLTLAILILLYCIRHLLALFASSLPQILTLVLTLVLILVLVLALGLALSQRHRHLRLVASGAIILVIISLIVLISLWLFKAAEYIEINVVGLLVLELV